MTLNIISDAFLFQILFPNMFLCRNPYEHIFLPDRYHLFPLFYCFENEIRFAKKANTFYLSLTYKHDLCRYVSTLESTEWKGFISCQIFNFVQFLLFDTYQLWYSPDQDSHKVPFPTLSIYQSTRMLKILSFWKKNIFKETTRDYKIIYYFTQL